MHLGRHLCLEHLGIATHEAARREEGSAGFGRKRGRFVHRVRHEFALRQDSVDEPELKRLIGAERLGEQQEFRRLGAPEALRRQERGACLWDQAKIDKAVKLGAKGGVIYKEKDWHLKLMSMLPNDNKQFDAIVDGAGADVVEKGAKLLKVGG